MLLVKCVEGDTIEKDHSICGMRDQHHWQPAKLLYKLGIIPLVKSKGKGERQG